MGRATSKHPNPRPEPVAPGLHPGFAAVEARLLELRRSVGLAGDAAPVHVDITPADVAPADVASEDAALVVEPEDLELEAAEVLAESDLEVTDPEVAGDPRDDVTLEEPAVLRTLERSDVRSRRGLGPDLLLLAAGWAGLIVLVVSALGRAS